MLWKITCVSVRRRLLDCVSGVMTFGLNLAEIRKFKPDVIILDPWNAAARDEKAREYLDTFQLIRSILPIGDDAPAIGIVAHTRKPRADEWANRPRSAELASRLLRARIRTANRVCDASRE